ncbi:MAG: hypothetical protein M3O15_10485, partial [Acidobacteriota bacterium]|nr:hypothetical protein [Acidobacteriota bacterium]
VSRSTLDIDLLAIDRLCLDPALWSGLRDEGVGIEIRRGNLSDPLAGVVRLSASGERPVDLVVGRSGWQRAALSRAAPGYYAGAALPVLCAADLILLKLYAGGPQDAWDIAQLLLAGDRPVLIAEVEARLSELPAGAAALWRTVVHPWS